MRGGLVVWLVPLFILIGCESENDVDRLAQARAEEAMSRLNEDNLLNGRSLEERSRMERIIKEETATAIYEDRSSD